MRPRFENYYEYLQRKQRVTWGYYLINQFDGPPTSIFIAIYLYLKFDEHN